MLAHASGVGFEQIAPTVVSFWPRYREIGAGETPKLRTFRIRGMLSLSPRGPWALRARG
jgi:hypothetical protein